MAIVTAPVIAWAAQPSTGQRSTGLLTRPADPDEQGEITLADYLRAIRSRYSRVDLEVLTPLNDQDDYPIIPLIQVFVPQQVKADPPPVELPREVTLRLRDSDLADPRLLPGSITQAQLNRVRQYEQRDPVDVLPLIAGEGRRLVLLGDPGSGKSTLARFIARRLAEPTVDGALAPLEGWLPILVELREYGRQDEHAAGDFMDFLDRQHAQHSTGLPRAFLEGHLERDGRAIVVFDGLDEIFDPARRNRVAGQIAGFAERHLKVRIVVTSRPVGYQRSVLEAAGFKRYKLQDLDLGRMALFVRQWYVIACGGDEGAAAPLERRLMDVIGSSTAIRELAGNPMLLTILAIIGRRQALPRDRSSVYKHAVTVLVEHWDPSKFLVSDRVGDLPFLDPADRLEMLRLIARKLQDSAAGLSGNYITGPDLMAEFVAFLQQRDPANISLGQAGVAAEQMLRQFRDRNFILSRFGGEVYGFVHRSFLEYLTAADIVHRFNNERSLSEADLVDGYFGRRCREVSWHEVLQLTAGMLDERFVNAAVLRMLSADPHWAAGDDVEPHHILVAIRCIGEVRKLGLLADSCRAAIDQLIRLLTVAHRRVTRSYSDSVNRAIEQSVLPVLMTFAAYWPGRETYLSWFQRSGFVEADDPVTGLTATRVAVTLGGDDPELRAFLELRASHGWSVNHRVAAAVGLVQGWPTDQRSLEIVRRQCAADPSWVVRLGALQAMVALAGQQKSTLGLLRARAVDDENEEIRRTAVRALATHWIDAPDTRSLLTGRATRDGHHYVRSAALEVIAERWPGDSAIRALVFRQGGTDPHEHVRQAALRLVAALWAGEVGSRSWLQDRAEADPSADVRRAGLTAIAKGWPGDTAWLRVRAVSDHHPGVRQAAVTAIAENDPGTAADLLGRLGDESGEVREAVLQALAGIGFGVPGFVEVLRGLAERDPSADVRLVALEALGPHVRHDDALQGWLRQRAQNDQNDRVRSTGVRLLSETWHEDPLVEIWLRETASRDRSASVRRAAVTSLATAGRDDDDTLPWLLRCAVDDPDVDVRMTAVHHIADGWAESPGVRTWLHARFANEPAEDVRNLVMRALVARWHNEPETYALLCAGAQQDRHEFIRRAAVWMIADGWPDEPGALTLLRGCAMNDTHEIVRRAAVQAVAVGWHDDPETLGLLLGRATDDPHEHVRAGVLRSIASGWHDDAATLPLLVRRATAEQHPAVRSLVLQIIVSGWPVTAESLHTALTLAAGDPAPAVRLTAVQALARFWHSDAAVAALLHRLATDDPDEDIRQAAHTAAR
ncbi:HEAT repeat domain-containing protein [Asanoa siamensis]|uniref:NACHT domain-containing protein n=1 Tax=Asanoa siamensis TaxID=926357 RepID=A0ABQ4CPK0_9ACTN|nr:HEAT repeat domain-containing protein [Asanoa siamensis]GIF72923.1 hypothetical protein Asi02nite_24410 [Asanoa siamensis]